VYVFIQGPNLRDQRKGQFHVHTVDCGDNKHYGPDTRFGGERDGMPVKVDTYEDVCEFIYEDMIAEHPDEPREDLIKAWLSDFWFAPCIKELKHRDPS